MNWKKVGILCAVATTAMLRAATPIAVWTDFTGLTAETPLAPEFSSTQDSVNGSGWRFQLNGGSVGDDGTLSTGTTAAPRIDFGGTINVGYSSANHPLTVLLALRGVSASPLEKPLMHIGNGSAGCGVALKTFDAGAGTATLTGCWGNTAWQNGTAANRVFPQANALTGDEVVYLALSCCPKTDTSSAAAVALIAPGTPVPAWTVITGLKAGGVGATGINFGNFVNATSGGMDYTLCGVAVYAGRPAFMEEFLPSYVWTYAGVSAFFHEGPWNVGAPEAPGTALGSLADWKGFASDMTEYRAPGRVLRFAPDAGTPRELDATFAHLTLGGLIVEPGATGYSFVSEANAQRYTHLGDIVNGTEKCALVFHEDFTIDRHDLRENILAETTTFYGPVRVEVDPEKTFSIVREAVVSSGSAVSLSGGGAFGCGAALRVAGSLEIADVALSGDMVLEGGEVSLLQAPEQTWRSLSGAGRVVSNAETTLRLGDLDLSSGALEVSDSLLVAPTGTLTLPPAPVTLTLGAIPEAVDFEHISRWPNGDYTLAVYAPGGQEGLWDSVRFENVPSCAEILPEGDALAVTVTHDTDNFILWPVGDSLTEGSGEQSDAPNYRAALVAKMAAEGMVPRTVGSRIFKHDLIDDEACWRHTSLYGMRLKTGGESGGLLQGVENLVEQAGYPDAVTLMIGSNDLSDSYEAGHSQVVFARWKALVQRLTALRPNSYIIVSPVTPLREDHEHYAEFAAAAEDYNASIKALFDPSSVTITVDGEEVPCIVGFLNAAGEETFGAGARVILASMADAIPATGNSAYFYDATHPNQKGYNRMAAVAFEAIQMIRGETGGLADALEMIDAYQTAGAMDALTVVFNHQLSEEQLADITVDGEAPAAASLSEDGRRAFLSLPAPLAHGTTATVALEDLSAEVAIEGASVEERVPEARQAGYVKVKTLAVPNQGGFHSAEAVAGAFSRTEEEITAFDRVAYYVTLARPDGALRYLWVSMETPYVSVDELGLPQAPLRQTVANLRVATNVPGIDPVEEDGVSGIVTFTPNTLKADSAEGQEPEGLAKTFDWNDTFTSTAYGYGAMQVYRLHSGEGEEFDLPASTLFGYSHWALSNADIDEILLGDLSLHRPYNAFSLGYATLNGIFTTTYPTFNASAWSVKNIEVWVRSAEEEIRTWNGSTAIWDATTSSAWEEDAPYVNGNRTHVVFPDLFQSEVTLAEDMQTLSTTVEGGMYAFSGATLTTQGDFTVGRGAIVFLDGPALASGTNLVLDERATVIHANAAVANQVYGGTFANGASLQIVSSVSLDDSEGAIRLEGSGSLTFSGAGWYALPALSLPTVALANNQAEGLVLAGLGDYEVGSLSGAKGFRIDWGAKEGDLSRTLTVNQTANTTYSAATILTTTANYPDRILNLTVKGSGDAKTLTLTGDHTCTDGDTEHVGMLTVDATGSVKLTGSWAGPAAVSGELYACGALGQSLALSGSPVLAVLEGQTLAVAGALVVEDGAHVAIALPEGFALEAGEKAALIAAASLPEDLSAFAVPEGFALSAAGGTLYLAAEEEDDGLVIIPPEGSEETYSERTVALISALLDETEGAGAVKTVTAVTLQANGDATTDVAAIENALDCFDGIAAVVVDPDDPTKAEILLGYTFAVESITRTDTSLVVVAAVEGTVTDSATFAQGVGISVIEVPSKATVESQLSLDGNRATLTFPLPAGATMFKVNVHRP